MILTNIDYNCLKLMILTLVIETLRRLQANDLQELLDKNSSEM